jgi:hypothetical protein
MICERDGCREPRSSAPEAPDRVLLLTPVKATARRAVQRALCLPYRGGSVPRVAVMDRPSASAERLSADPPQDFATRLALR